MSRYHSYLNTAVTILSRYDGREPLSGYLKKFYAENKKYGSGDRKQITQLCYSYFRLGHALKDMPVEERILAGVFLSSEKPGDLLGFHRPVWNEKVRLPVREKLSFLNLAEIEQAIFPWKHEISKRIDPEAFSLSHLVQPLLYLRIRPGYENTVSGKLNKAGISFNEISAGCLSLPNTSKLGGVIELDKEAVVQDYNSQQVGTLIKNLYGETGAGSFRVWDCCAGSGGKSILLKDLYPEADLTVSDIRKSILVNLRNRFSEAGIQHYRSFQADLSTPPVQVSKDHFDLVVADLPCTGSGTWSRTPEELYFFKEEEIERFSSLQRQIVLNILPHLKPGGSLLYITCSVFKKENEENVNKLVEEFGLEIIQQELFEGYGMQADTLFGALLRK